MKTLFTFVFYCCFTLIGSNFSSAQLQISPDYFANLVQFNFLSNDYLVFNIQYTGHPNAIGHFDGTNTTMGLGKGMFLTTGLPISDTVNNPLGPNDLPNAGVDNGYPGTYLFNGLSGSQNIGQTFNAAILEFDVIPFTDTLKMKFIYASEEYPEYVGHLFLDPMAILISGPGIVGQKNIGSVPVTQNLIQVNTVNNGPTNNGPCTNCFFYQANGTGTNAPYNSSDTYIQFDGFTKPLYAFQDNLQIGETYHILLMIADAEDGIFDSGLFIESCVNCNGYLSTENETLENFQIAPNPASSNVELLGIQDKSGVSQIELIDHMGKQVLVFTKYIENIDISGISKGLYFIRITADGKSSSQKLLIE